jgi:glutamate/tyrosine decarboxylase-like PLP-dependent enzyme
MCVVIGVVLSGISVSFAVRSYAIDPVDLQRRSVFSIAVPSRIDDSSRQDVLDRLRRLERAARPLDPGVRRRKRLRDAVVASSERFLRSIEDHKGYVETDDKGIALLEAPIGENGVSIERAIALLEHDVVRPGAQPATGGHLAYIPGGGLYHSALGDFIAAVTNKYAGVFFAGPGAVRMENMLLRWASDLVGYPATAGGHLASGGSLATLAAIATARDAHGVKSADVARAVVYLTPQAHHCISKALGLAGLGEAVVHRVAVDDRSRMRVDTLEAAIAADRAEGLRPWLIVASAGTTDTGAVDPIAAIADVAERERCWYHVDAAYGGFFLLTEEGRVAMAGIERSDSVVLDPHKSLFLPYGSGMLLVRDVSTLVATNGYSGTYMQDALGDPSELSPADLSPELTKHFRGLRMWLPLVLLGVKPFRAALEEKLLLAQYFREEIATAGFEVGPPPDLSIVTYRWAPAGVELEHANAINREIVEGSRRDGRVFISSTTLDGRFTLRAAIVAFRTHRRTIDLAVRVLREQAEAAARQGTGSGAKR